MVHLLELIPNFRRLFHKVNARQYKWCSWLISANSISLMSVVFLIDRGYLTHCGLVTPYGDIIWVNIGSGNGLLPEGTKPLPEPMLTYH